MRLRIAVPRPRSCAVVSAGCLAVAVLLFAMSPLVALWSVNRALRDHDVGLLRQALDWRSVQDGLKQDLGPGLPVDLSGTVAPPDALPGFGDSFATRIVSRAVDRSVTPERLVRMLQDTASRRRAGTAPLLRSIRFLGPLRVEVALRVSGAADPARLAMRVEHWRWTITRVHLPPPGDRA